MLGLWKAVLIMWVHRDRGGRNAASSSAGSWVQDGAGTGIHSAVVRATGRSAVFESRAHLVLQDEVVYAGDCPAISDDRIQLFRTQHSWMTCLR